MLPKEFVRKVPSYMSHGAEEQGDDLERGRFTGFLKCKFGLCGEIVVLSGDYFEYTRCNLNPETDEYEEVVYMSYAPRIMHPAPPVINIPKKLCEKAEVQLKLSFGLLWSDAGACANRLRIVVELLLDQLGVPREGKKCDKKARLDLSDRINILETTKPGHKNALDALRYVGNVGSHDGDVAFDDVVDCFEILEDTLVELIDERRTRLEAKVKDINDRKGKPRSI